MEHINGSLDKVREQAEISMERAKPRAADVSSLREDRQQIDDGVGHGP